MTSAIYQELSERAAVIYEKVVMWRRDFHRYPELAGHEERTSGLVAEHLRALGLEVAEHVGGFGVVGLLRGEAGNGPVIGFRADMDALPLQEQTGFPYASKIPGVMHACGHDAHTAMLMGTAEVLSAMRTQLVVRGFSAMGAGTSYSAMPRRSIRRSTGTFLFSRPPSTGP